MLLPALAWAQPAECPTCELGIWDGADLNTNCGTVTPLVAKDLYIGLNLTGAEIGITGLEFSISNLRQAEDGILVTATDGITEVPPNIILGSVVAPADTSATSTQTGGINVNWPSCVSGTKLPLLKVTILTFSPITDKVFTVMHRFPPTNPTFGLLGPVAIRCNAPEFTAVKISGGYYVANPSASPPRICKVAVLPETWSTVKGLYR
jgi:hypothetical protein